MFDCEPRVTYYSIRKAVYPISDLLTMESINNPFRVLTMASINNPFHESTSRLGADASLLVLRQIVDILDQVAEDL